MFGLNPVATGILLGAVGGPVGMGLGAGIGAMYDHAQGQKRDAQKAMHGLQQQGVNNQNALVTENFNKRKDAFGIGEEVAPAPMGNAASQTGAAMPSILG
jgi:hypothetical protein